MILEAKISESPKQDIIEKFLSTRNLQSAVPYQACPICLGSGNAPESVKGNENMIIVTKHSCHICHGAGIIPMMVIEKRLK